ncbi:hypothetical protein [Saccharopolyspora hattusasensis]|uniref:hypothetical protein n=1 Tax=Saccharopolyspora hattusasensis TaxID=1128679 RepID=UPI003D9661F9
MRAESDYDAEIIEGFDLKRTRDRENAHIDALERERRKLTMSNGLGPVLEAKGPVAEFNAANLIDPSPGCRLLRRSEAPPAPAGKDDVRSCNGVRHAEASGTGQLILRFLVEIERSDRAPHEIQEKPR